MQLDPDGKVRPKPVPWTPEQTREYFYTHYVPEFLGYKTLCWKWTGCVNSYGYGIIKFNGKLIGAHRYIAILHLGNPPHPKSLACHVCDQPICVNPEHIYWGDYKSNMHDMIKRGRDIHAKGELASKSKLTVPLVLKIRNLRKDGLTFRKIASIVGVSKSAIQNVIYGETWRHVP